MDKVKIGRLVERFRAGDSMAFEELFAGTKDELYGYGRLLTKDEDAIEDALQETYIKAFQKLGNLGDPQAFVPWCRAILRNEINMFFRSSHETTVDPYADEEGNESDFFDDLQETEEEFLPGEEMDKKAVRDIVGESLGGLSEVQRHTTVLYYYDEYSISDIAHIMECSEGTVKSRLNSSRAAMRDSLTDYEKKNGIALHAIMPFAAVQGVISQVVGEAAMPAGMASSIFGSLAQSVAGAGIGVTAGSALGGMAGSYAGTLGAGAAAGTIGAAAGKGTIGSGATGSLAAGQGAELGGTAGTVGAVSASAQGGSFAGGASAGAGTGIGAANMGSVAGMSAQSTAAGSSFAAGVSSGSAAQGANIGTGAAAQAASQGGYAGANIGAQAASQGSQMGAGTAAAGSVKGTAYGAGAAKGGAAMAAGAAVKTGISGKAIAAIIAGVIAIGGGGGAAAAHFLGDGAPDTSQGGTAPAVTQEQRAEDVRAAYSDHFSDLLADYSLDSEYTEPTVYIIDLDQNEIPDFIFYDFPGNSKMANDSLDDAAAIDEGYYASGEVCAYTDGKIVTDDQGFLSPRFEGSHTYFLSSDRTKLYKADVPTDGAEPIEWKISEVSVGSDSIEYKELSSGTANVADSNAVYEEMRRTAGGEPVYLMQSDHGISGNDYITMYIDKYTDAMGNVKAYMSRYGIDIEKEGSESDWREAYADFLETERNGDIGTLDFADESPEGKFRIAMVDLNEDDVPEVALEIIAPVSGGHFTGFFGYGRGHVSFFKNIGFLEAHGDNFRYDAENKSLHYMGGHGSDGSFFESGEVTACETGLCLKHRQVVMREWTAADPIDTVYDDSILKYDAESVDFQKYEELKQQYEELDWQEFDTFDDMIAYIRSL